MEEVEEVQKEAAAMGYLDGEQEDDIESSGIHEGDIIMFDENAEQVDDKDEQVEEEEEYEDEDVKILEEDFMRGSDLRGSSRLLISALQPLYEEEEEESEPFHASHDEEHQSSVDSGIYPENSDENGMMIGTVGQANRAQRGSFVANRRSSVESLESQKSTHSAPERNDFNVSTTYPTGEVNRRASFASNRQNSNSIASLFG